MSHLDSEAWAYCTELARRLIHQVQDSLTQIWLGMFTVFHIISWGGPWLRVLHWAGVCLATQHFGWSPWGHGASNRASQRRSEVTPVCPWTVPCWPQWHRMCA